MAQLDALTTPLTTAEVRTSIYQVLGILGTDTSNWKPWSVLRILITAVSIAIAAVSQMTALIARSGFLSLAEGEWLSLKTEQDYGVSRILASYATGQLLAQNSSGNDYHLLPGELIVRNPATLKLYANSATVDILALSSNTPVDIVAQEAGSASNALPGAITELVTVYTGVSVANTLALTAADEETSPALRARAVASTGALSPNGPNDAYRYIAASAVRPDGSAIGVTRVLARPDGNGYVDVYLAVPSGALVAGDVTIIDELLQRQCVPLTATLRTHSAAAASLAVAYTVWLPASAGFTTAAVTSAIQAALVAYLANEPIGGRVIGIDRGIWASALEAEIVRALTPQGQPLQIFRAAVAVPATFFAMTAQQVAVLGPVTANVIMVP